MSQYFTILRSTESLFKEKGSKFIGLAYPVRSEEEIKRRIAEVRSTYHDARHHCFAWKLGMDLQSSRANDDGEPSHSAGDPILGQISAHELTNVLVVVVRYFGGTKLGVGGLINAYKTAADEALSLTDRLQIFEMREVSLEFKYPQMSAAERLIADFGIEVTDRDFKESCVISGLIKKDRIEAFLGSTEQHYNMKISIAK